MADRYWVGGTDSWDAVVGTKWATTSGGAGGQTVPTALDNAIFDANSGAVTVTVSGNRTCADLRFTDFTGTFTVGAQVSVSGNITLSPSMTLTATGSFPVAPQTNCVINMAGVQTFEPVLNIQAKSGGVVTLANTHPNGVTLPRGLTCTNGNVTFVNTTFDVYTRFSLLNGNSVWNFSNSTINLHGSPMRFELPEAPIFGSLVASANFAGTTVNVDADTSIVLYITGIEAPTMVFGSNCFITFDSTLSPPNFLRFSSAQFGPRCTMNIPWGAPTLYVNGTITTTASNINDMVTFIPQDGDRAIFTSLSGAENNMDYVFIAGGSFSNAVWNARNSVAVQCTGLNLVSIPSAISLPGVF